MPQRVHVLIFLVALLTAQSAAQSPIQKRRPGFLPIPNDFDAVRDQIQQSRQRRVDQTRPEFSAADGQAAAAVPHSGVHEAASDQTAFAQASAMIRNSEDLANSRPSLGMVDHDDRQAAAKVAEEMDVPSSLDDSVRASGGEEEEDDADDCHHNMQRVCEHCLKITRRAIAYPNCLQDVGNAFGWCCRIYHYSRNQN